MISRHLFEPKLCNGENISLLSQVFKFTEANQQPKTETVLSCEQLTLYKLL